MFDGTPIVKLDSPDLFLFTLALAVLGMVVWVRQGFLKEWRLADWLIYSINRIWQRGADEVPQAEGIFVNHIAGILSLSLIGWFDLPIYIGLGVAFSIVISRQIMFWVIRQIPRIAQLGNEHSIIDRLCRFWMSTCIGGVALVFSLIPSPENFSPFLVFGVIWIVSLLFRWFRVIQSANRRLHSFSYSFLYLCALEIFPVLAFIKLMSASTVWI